MNRHPSAAERLRIAFAEIFRSGKREAKNGAAWFTLSNFLPAGVSVLMGPLILKKVGLEDYAVVSMAGYLLSLIFIYSDFGGYPHLLAAFSKSSAERFTDLANALVLKAAMLAAAFGALGLFALGHPRQDLLYPFLALSMIGLFLPTMTADWYLIANKRYFQIFLYRSLMNACLILLICAWVFSPGRNLLVFPFLNLAAGSVASGYLLGVLGWKKISRAVRYIGDFSLRAFGGYLWRILPLAATQLVTPYFLSYALVWFSLVESDPKLVGAFSIGYRIVIGFSGLAGPLVFYFMARAKESTHTLSFRKTFGASLLGIAGLWVIGAIVIGFYFLISKVDPMFLGYSLQIFSILMLGLFFVFLRTLYVSRCAGSGRYRLYFLIHFFACAPLLLASFFMRGRVSASLVPWLACLPDLFATAGFVFYYKFELSKHESSTLATREKP